MKNRRHINRNKAMKTKNKENRTMIGRLHEFVTSLRNSIYPKKVWIRKFKVED